MRVRQQDGPGRPTSVASPMTGRGDWRDCARWLARLVALTLTRAQMVSKALEPQLPALHPPLAATWGTIVGRFTFVLR